MVLGRRLSFRLVAAAGGIIVVTALFLTSCGPSAPPRLSPPPSTLSSVGVGITPSPLPTSAPAEISPTPEVNLAATLTEPLASQPAAAYPAPAQSETPAPAVAYPAPAPSETATPVSATVGASEGRLAPDFDLVRENGARVRLSDYRGKETVVLVFFRGQT